MTDAADKWRQNIMSLPLGASPNDRAEGFTETGELVYITQSGHRYWFRDMPAPPPLPLKDKLKAIPGALARSLWNGLQTPGRAARGEPVRLGDAFDTLGLAQFGGVGVSASRRPLRNEMVASRQESLYTRPTQSEVGDALGRQHSGGVDLEGRPLVARYVVGRSPERKVEQSLPSEALAEIVQATTGRSIEGVAPRQLRGGTVGQTRFDRVSRRPLGLEVRAGLPPAAFDNVARHEVGHLIDEIAGQIDTKGLSAELKPLYHYGLEGRERPRKHTQPEHLGYSAGETPREYMAEAIRQYMGAPDAMKQMAPKTAARVRAAVNTHPQLSPLIQFNANASRLAGGIALSMGPAPQDDKAAKAQIRAYLASRGELK